MSKQNPPPIILPALRGIMGNWVYYSCLMDLHELSTRIDYAKEVHQNKFLSDMIQRTLKGDRSSQIASYLKTQPERFFNSLVIATYGGQPNWHAFSDVRNQSKSRELRDLSEETVASVGFLTLQGDEKLFALDGQHRLAGIKKAVEDGLQQEPYDEVSVIFVAHKATTEGLQRTRRLFTTLNKTARPVSKGDIIALDEDDVMAICVRRLIEETDLFMGERIAFVASNNIPVANATSLTTIGNLYDLLAILFTNAKFELTTKKADLQKVRPNDEDLNKYFQFAKSYFEQLGKRVQELGAFFSAQNTKTVVRRYRGVRRGSALFRPIGLAIFTRIVARLSRDMTLVRAVNLAAKLPRRLDAAPYEGLMWDSSNQTILSGHNVTLREILLFMVGKNARKYREDVLVERYRKETGNPAAQLPRRVV